MKAKLKSLVGLIQQLTLAEQVEIIQAISKSFAHSYSRIVQSMRTGKPQEMEQFAIAQASTPIKDIGKLAVDFWPGEESADDFIEYTYRQRQEDRLLD